jgi:hypothetical protein
LRAVSRARVTPWSVPGFYAGRSRWAGFLGQRCRKLHARADPELCEHLAQMPFAREPADEKLRAGLRVRQAVGGEAGDPVLPRYEAVNQRGSTSAGTGRPPGLDMHDSSKDEARRLIADQAIATTRSSGPTPARRALTRLPEKVATAVIEFLYGSLAANPHRAGTPLKFDLEGLHSAPPWGLPDHLPHRRRRSPDRRHCHRTPSRRPPPTPCVGTHPTHHGPSLAPRLRVLGLVRGIHKRRPPSRVPDLIRHQKVST